MPDAPSHPRVYRWIQAQSRHDRASTADVLSVTQRAARTAARVRRCQASCTLPASSRWRGDAVMPGAVEQAIRTLCHLLGKCVERFAIA
jgi:hypothetical protein